MIASDTKEIMKIILIFAALFSIALITILFELNENYKQRNKVKIGTANQYPPTKGNQ